MVRCFRCGCVAYIVNPLSPLIHSGKLRSYQGYYHVSDIEFARSATNV